MATILVADDKVLNRSVLTTLLGYRDLMRVPIIVVSALDPLINEQRALEAGAEVFLQKPLENEEFLAAGDKAPSKSAGVKP
jgi:CheY-like chemotaxis protein